MTRLSSSSAATAEALTARAKKALSAVKENMVDVVGKSVNSFALFWENSGPKI